MDIFKKEDFEGLKDVFSAYDINTVTSEISKKANALLKGRLSVGYTSELDLDDDNAWDIPSEKQTNEDTHKMYFFVEPLEEENPPCTHNAYRWYIGSEDDKLHKLKNDFCPKCGEKLNRC